MSEVTSASVCHAASSRSIVAVVVAAVTASCDIASWVKLIMKSRNYEDLNTYIVQGVTSGPTLEMAVAR